MFNMIYSIAISCLVQRLHSLGVVLSFQPQVTNFWQPRNKYTSPCFVNESTPTSNICYSDVEFVDDAALLLSAATPGKMQTAIPKVLALLSSIFKRFGFRINWKEGKT